MKQNFVIILGAAVFGILLSAYLFAYATTVREPVEWQNGDVIVQNSNIENILPVFAVVGGYTHIGVVEMREDGAVVIEAADKVRETPMREFLKRGQDGMFAVFRFNGLTAGQGKAVVEAARRQIGKPNDYYLGHSWEQLYSSELVRLAFSDVGIDVGRPQKLKRLPGDVGGVFMRAWSDNADCQRRNLTYEQCWDWYSKQEVVTPASIVDDARMTKLYETQPQSQAVAFFPAAESEEEAPPSEAPTN